MILLSLTILITLLLCILPLRGLYILSDRLFYPLIYHVVRYRRKLVRKNLRLSFPEWSKHEIVKVEKKFYHHFADLLVETIYGCRASEEEMRKRMKFTNLEMIEHYAHTHGGVIFMLGHLDNWEWIADIAHRYEDTEIHHYNVYRRPKQQWADRLIGYVRRLRGGECIEKNSLLRRMVALRHDGHPKTYGLLSDQKPSPNNQYHYTTFLHQRTAFLGGGEQLAAKFGYAVLYPHTTCVSRGYYECTLELISDDAANGSRGQITELFARKLEQNILERPEQWLWTHNRWKWTRASED